MSPAILDDAEINGMLNLYIRADSSMDKYPAKGHAMRVAQKLGVDRGLLVLAATKSELWPNSDMPAPFRQDRYFYYLTGCNEPDCYVTYSIEWDRLTLWLPPVDSDWRHVVFYGNGSTVEQALETYDIDEARYIEHFKPSQDLPAQSRYILQSFKHADPGLASTTSEALQAECAFYSVVLGEKVPPIPIFSLEDRPLFGIWPNVNQYSLRSAMNACRVIKDKHEIELIRQANEITAAAHRNVFQNFHAFKNEAAVEAAYMSPCIERHAKEQAYDPIVGSGANAAVLHYSRNQADFGSAQTVVLDAGCEVKCYASDVTRTIPINKKNPGHWPSKEAEEIYKLVEKVQESCIKQMLRGNKYIDITWHAHRVVIEGLLKLGILKGHPRLIFHSGISNAFLPHGLGHHVGLDVHDVSPVPPPPALQSDSTSADEVRRLREAFVRWDPDSSAYAAKLTKREHFVVNPSCQASVGSVDAPSLEIGMVITVEPGIYFNDFLLKQFFKDPSRSRFVDIEVLKRYLPVGGVRIEDDILITKDGPENLTTAPKGEEMLAIIRESAQTTIKAKSLSNT